MGTQLPLPQRGTAPIFCPYLLWPIFGPCLLQPNGCMDKNATWYGGRPRPRLHCVRCGLRSPLPNYWLIHVYCGQTAGWIKMSLATELGLSAGDTVLDDTFRQASASSRVLYCGQSTPYSHLVGFLFHLGGSHIHRQTLLFNSDI